MDRYLGFDGFPRGWVMAWIDDRGQHGFDYSPTLTRLLAVPHRRAMIDIPIGLPDAGFRKCDEEARKRLGPSVFPGVRRSILKFEKYEHANEDYWNSEGPGKGISRQLWSIRDKIKEVDDLMTPSRQNTLAETHPELVFDARSKAEKLGGKKTESGRHQRIAILNRLGFTKIQTWLGWRFGTGIGRDDLIDACACAIAARDARETLTQPERDSRGLAMEMHY